MSKQFEAAENIPASIEFTLIATWTGFVVLYHELRWGLTKDKSINKNKSAFSISVQPRNKDELLIHKLLKAHDEAAAVLLRKQLFFVPHWHKLRFLAVWLINFSSVSL